MDTPLLRVLIVEDDPLIAEDIRSLLESEGFNISGVAHDGSQALDFLKVRDPDLVLLDINLGTGLSGLDVAEVIQRDYKLPFIFVTSFDDETTLMEAQQHSPYGYIVKPFQDRTLLATIKIAHFNYSQSQKEQQISKDDIEALTRAKLTLQEYKIILSLLRAKSYKDIASQEFVSVNTIKFHAKNIYSKLQIKGRSELASLLLS